MRGTINSATNSSSFCYAQLVNKFQTCVPSSVLTLQVYATRWTLMRGTINSATNSSFFCYPQLVNEFQTCVLSFLLFNCQGKNSNATTVNRVNLCIYMNADEGDYLLRHHFHHFSPFVILSFLHLSREKTIFKKLLVIWGRDSTKVYFCTTALPIYHSKSPIFPQVTY